MAWRNIISTIGHKTWQYINLAAAKEKKWRENGMAWRQQRRASLLRRVSPCAKQHRRRSRVAAASGSVTKKRSIAARLKHNACSAASAPRRASQARAMPSREPPARRAHWLRICSSGSSKAANRHDGSGQTNALAAAYAHAGGDGAIMRWRGSGTAQGASWRQPLLQSVLFSACLPHD